MYNARVKLTLDWKKLPGVLIAIVLLGIAVILLEPFFKIDRSDYEKGASSVYRLAIGLTILLIYLGKWFFDVFSPQGLGYKVSGLKGALLVALAMVIMAFVVFIIIQAGSLYLTTAASESSSEIPF
jgi:hypothetical protein